MRVWPGIVIGGVLVALSIRSAAQPDPSDVPVPAVDAGVPADAAPSAIDAPAPAAPQPVVVVVPAAAPPTPQASGTLGAYVDDSVFVATAGGAELRVALGIEVAHIAAGGHASYRLRVGASAYAYTQGSRNAGVGVEGQFDWPLGPKLRIGVRASGETGASNTSIVSIGPRLILSETLWFGVEVGRLASGGAGPAGVLIGGGLLL